MAMAAVDFAVTYGLDTDQKRQDYFGASCQANDLDGVNILLTDRPRNRFTIDPNCKFEGGRPLFWACDKGHWAIVDRLLQDDRVDPTADNNKAFQVAASKGYLAIVCRLLEDKRVDPAADNNYAIRVSSSNGHLAIVRRLLEDKRVDPAADNNYAIRMAALHCSPDESDDDDDKTSDNDNDDDYPDVKVEVDDDANDSDCEKNHVAVVERLLQDERVDPCALHKFFIGFATTSQCSFSALTDAMLPRLAASLTLPL
jgi:hypothetical protein